YDYAEDSLFMYNEKKKSGGSVELGELVIDLDRAGNVAALEISGASKYLSELTGRKLSRAQLKKMDEAAITVNAKKGTIIIKIFLPIENEKVPATIAVQNMNYNSPALAHA
ncbi:MAG TPA: DUF2283 domain-containing protein, partial [archaeon]|nr:DUF2283 domain-containing protein [archaeon]